MAESIGVLVVSEDGPTVEEVARILLELDSVVYTASSPAEADAVAARHPLSVVIADARLSRSGPVCIVSQLRRRTDAPLLLLAADDADLIERCLESGADDCVRWPVSSRELLARIRLRTGSGNGKVRTPASRIELDHNGRTAAVDGRIVELTDREFELLAFLAARPGETFSPDQLLDAVWHSSRDWQAVSTVREHVYRLRHKLEVDPSDPELIITARGHGYRLDI